MNRRLDVVVNVIAGETQTKIIDVFVAGDTNGLSLAKHRHFYCRKSEGEIANALHCNGRKIYLFALQQEWNTCKHLQQQILETGKRIREIFKTIINKDDNKISQIKNRTNAKAKTV